ncbi:MAG: sugar ABC transporter ATP-binding protein [Chloroflexota bacterium]|nr:sugar ABC transporter ATP-binding protein [Chloroflexota bacterium]
MTGYPEGASPSLNFFRQHLVLLMPPSLTSDYRQSIIDHFTVTDSPDKTFLQMEGISKSFPGVQALDQVDFEVAPGEIHALVGENGAGKSTLMKILTGAQPSDQGRILLRGRQVDINSPSDAQDLGISMIHQELSLIPYLTVGQNIYLGREPQRAIPSFIDWSCLYDDSQRLLDRLDMEIDPRSEVMGLSIAQQQMIEVAKALSLSADLIVMDEPTSALTDRETDILFQQMRSLRADGVSLIFISHRLEEIFEIADRVTVLRDGKTVGTVRSSDVDEERIVQMMVGRELGEMYPKAATEKREVVLEARDLEDGRELHGVNLQLHRGEILGIAGLVGAGRTALAETLFGIRPVKGGQILFEEEEVRLRSPSDAIELGIGLVPEDRKQLGLFMSMAVRNNITISSMDQVTAGGFLNFSSINRLAGEFVEKLDIRTPSLLQRVGNLSGGNQQKVVIARWLTLEPRVLILDEPTRGIDVGAKAEIHGLMSQLAQEGVGVLMISSELPEVLGVSDRILVMHEGRIEGEFSRDEANQDDIMRAATGTMAAMNSGNGGLHGQ